jgi:hypothetical protein
MMRSREMQRSSEDTIDIAFHRARAVAMRRRVLRSRAMRSAVRRKATVNFALAILGMIAAAVISAATPERWA